MKKDTVVLGLGNLLMSDEGVGCVLINQFIAQSDKYPSVEFIDAGTGGMSILHLIAGREKAVLIDCAYMGTKPGTIKKFKPDEVESLKKLAHHSLHEADMLKVIELAKQLDQCPQEVVIFGIQPGKVEAGQGLSETLTAKMNDYIAAVSRELTL
jgi:hydrogenase maturation protease